MEEKIIEMLSLHMEQIIGVLGVLFFVGFDAYLILSNKEMLAKKRRCTKKTIGTVIHAERTYHDILHQGDDDRGRHDHLNYSYTLEYEVGGHTYRLSDTSHYSWVGEKMKVYYNPANPQESQIGGMGLAIWVNYFVIVFFAFAIIITIQFVILRAPDRENDIENEADTMNELAINDETDMDTENDEQTESQSKQEDRNQNWDSMIYGDIVLMQQTQADQVCIAVQPSVLRKYRYYYYIAEGEDQQWLQEFLENLLLEGKPYEGKGEGMKPKGWQIIYQNRSIMVYEGGYLQSTYWDETGEVMEYFVEAPEVCDYIQIMLQEKLDYYSFNPENIENIVSAKLDVCSINTNGEFYTQTITDEETLQLFEEWFRNAEYINGVADCGNQNACLELVLANGETVRLSVATDSCANFGINGIYYDYSPTDDWDNREFFARFDEIPWNWDVGL